MAHVLPLSDVAVREVAQRLTNGEIIVYGCDSNYIMCTNMSSASSVRRIFDLKGRAYQQALPIIIDPHPSSQDRITTIRVLVLVQRLVCD
jgi:tRNA A37 threonylcarbamoyladenosine synthetase subunit TsaC/SUA5/YrdC